MRIHVRPALAGDRAEVEAIVQSAYARWLPRLERKPAPMLDDYGARIAAGFVHVAELDVAEADGGVRGLVVLIPQADFLLLDNVAVAVDAQGAGLGRLLLAFAEERARDAGYRAIRLYTNELMTENIALYARLGYVEIGRSEVDGRRRVDMEKRLL